MADPIPVLDEDIFSRESVRDARAVDDRVRELAPVVRLGREDVVVIGRFSHVSAGLADWRSSAHRVATLLLALDELEAKERNEKKSTS